MYWTERLTSLPGPHTINDSKTPSGRLHVGSLRGVLIHDAAFRTLTAAEIPARYLYGVDDYDPLDELPAQHREVFEPYLGVPLCNVPAPPGSVAPDFAEHFIGEFLDVFRELGVQAEIYRMRDVYRSGQLNEVIDVILRHAPDVRRIYAEVSNSQRPEHWHPFNVVCERCGRVGTTEVIDYDGREVTYVCSENLVEWARGCGFKGKASPFNGGGKLPWKLEWVAKWVTFGVTIEGAGKDHSVRGGSRDVAEACLRAIFARRPPFNIPYEFFLVGGARMSSSRGVGFSARAMASLLPPEILRFLVLRTQPQTAVNFAPDLDNLVKLFNDYDRYHTRYYQPAVARPDERRVYELAQVGQPEGPYYVPNFQLVLAVVQLPHVEAVAEFTKRKGAPLTELELQHLGQRIESARHWLEHYAAEEDRIELQQDLPARAGLLTATQRAFLQLLADALEHAAWDEETLQSTIFGVARLTPLAQADAFAALYRIFLDRTSGPRAGSLLSFLDRAFVVGRCRELPFSEPEFWLETAAPAEAFEQWLEENRPAIESATARGHYVGADVLLALRDSGQRLFHGVGILEFIVTVDDGKTQMKRVALGSPMISDKTTSNAHEHNEQEYFVTYASEYVKDLAIKLGKPIPFEALEPVRP